MQVIENLGGKTILFFLSLFEGVKLTLISIFYLLLPTSYTAQMRKTLTKQIYYTSIQPLTMFLFLALAFGVSLLGALISLAVEFHLQDKIGLLSIKFSVNEFAPFFTALFIALHSSPIINTRLLQSRSEDSPSTQMSLDTLMIFLLPRVLGGILSALSLGVLVMVLVLSSSYIFVLFYLNMDINGYLYILKSAIEPMDIIIFLIKSIVFGFMTMFIPIFYAYQSQSSSINMPNLLLKSILKLLLALFFVEVLSLLIPLL